MALESNPTLEQARMAIRAAQGEHRQAGLYPNPVLGYVGDEMGVEGSAGKQGAVVAQEFVTAGKLRLGRAAAGHAVEQARHGWEKQRRRVMNDVRVGYYEVLIAQRMLDVNGQLVRIGDEGVRIAELLREAMEVGRADVLQARIEADTARLSLDVAENRHRAAWRRLAGVLGRPDLGPAPLEGDVESNLPEFTWDDCLARLLAQSPELARARAGVERARCELARQCAERFPNFEIGLAVKRDTADMGTVADVEIGMPIPIFHRNQGHVAKAEAELIAAQREIRRIELDLHNRLTDAFEQYANARRHVETYRDRVLPDARASLELVRTGYREGEFGYLTLLTSQRTYFSVSLEYLGNLRELWIQSVGLEGLLLRGGLQAPE
jgi:cobalt-zinc-cadmium efflux system outer membrane protein